MRRIAIPVVNNKLSAHFGHCEFFAFFDEENGKIIARKDLPSPLHQPGTIPLWLAQQGATDIISGGMGSMAQQLFVKNNINVILGAPEINPEQVARDFINETLNSGDNSCDHEEGHGHGNHHHHH